MQGVVAVGVLCLALAGCNGSAPSSTKSPRTTPSDAVVPSVTVEVTSTDAAEDEADWVALGDELVEMARIDQEERANFGDPDLEPFNDEPRTARLIEIVDQHGWPTPDVAGVEANSAAFLIAQHSVSDPAFQQRVLSLIQASDPYDGQGEQEALLGDRIAANSGQPQLFGTQINCLDGEPIVQPALARPEDVDELRTEAGLEPLNVYMARFDQHCTEVALIPEQAGCGPVGGFGLVIEPNVVLLVGELHGTVQSPSFVSETVCTALSYGYDVTVGLEIPDGETGAVTEYLGSDGQAAARNALLASPFWTVEVKDGRQSAAMFDLIEDLRQHTAVGDPVEVVLLDASGVEDRDVAMADNLLEEISEETDGVAITLTGNLHNRTTRGTDFDSDYEPMGYLVEQALGPQRVRSLDVHYTGGEAWVCIPDSECGPRRFDAPPNDSSPRLDVLPSIEIGVDDSGAAFDGRYRVGDLTPSPPAIGN